jgi:ribosomal protein S18 acetylase RimI-like enzyme
VSDPLGMRGTERVIEGEGFSQRPVVLLKKGREPARIGALRGGEEASRCSRTTWWSSVPAALRSVYREDATSIRCYRSAMKIAFRPAAATDVEAAVPLIYSSGPAAFDYVFTVKDRRPTAEDFLRRAFLDGAGEFGWRNHVVGEFEGMIVAAGAGWTGRMGFRFMIAGARQILACYGPVVGAGVIARALRVEAIVPPPSRTRFVVAHLGVRPETRGQGIGQRLIEHLLDHGRTLGVEIAALDVAVANTSAQALYERLGFVVTGERRSRLSNASVTVPDHRHMERPI